MSRRFRSRLPEDTFNIWTSFTDLMSNAFMVLTLLLLLAISKTPTRQKLQQPDNNKQKIIVLPSEEYKFASGSAELPINLSRDIQNNLKDGKILQAIKQQLDNIQNKIDIIEVIGHTDGQEVGSLSCQNKFSGRGNLDQELEAVATQAKNVAILCPGSNTDLGLMRALAVIKELQKAQTKQEKGRFKQVSFRAYSSGQLLLPENRGFAKPERKEDKQRRRIEIRFTQLAQETTPE